MPTVTRIITEQERARTMIRRNELGISGSIVIIFVLFLALMGTLGLVFYQNFIEKKPVEPQSTNSANKTQSPQLTTARIAYNSTIYDVDYPAGWTVLPMTTQTASTLTLTSGSGEARVNLSFSSTPAANTCDPTDGLQIHDYSVDTTNVVKSLTSTPVYLVEAIYDAPGGGYQYTIGLVPYGGDTNASLNTSHCTVSHVGIAASVLMNRQAVVHPTVLATITFPKLPAAPKAAAPDMQTIKALINSDDYKAAVAIIESARKE